jgi:hypothetical protein
MAPMRAARWLRLLLVLTLALPAWGPPAVAAAATEHQVKAVFLFNFSHFIQWPAGTFTTPTQPFVIGVLGGDALAAQLDEAVRGERFDEHPLLVRRLRSVDEIGDCQILFIDRAEGAQLDRILQTQPRRGMLTVSDAEGAARRGIMIQLATQASRVRLLINVESARAAGLTISSNLLRPAEIVRTGN